MMLKWLAVFIEDYYWQINTSRDSSVFRYHDMPDVLDFIVLRHTHDLAMTRNWKVGEHFEPTKLCPIIFYIPDNFSLGLEKGQ